MKRKCVLHVFIIYYVSFKRKQFVKVANLKKLLDLFTCNFLDKTIQTILERVIDSQNLVFYLSIFNAFPSSSTLFVIIY